MKREPAILQTGDRVQVFLDSTYWQSEGWFQGTVVRVDPYSNHRSFHWVELDLEARPVQGGSTRFVSVLNPQHIMRI